MNKIFLIISLYPLFLISCKENEQIVYNEKPAVYFKQKIDSDSINYSFTTTLENIDTVLLKVNLLGELKEDRYFKIKVNESSTAVEGSHYLALEEKYLIKAGEYSFDVPVYLIKNDNLDSETVSVITDLIADDNFDIGYNKYSKSRLFITNQVVKPTYWDDLLQLYFSVYSKKKHEICISLMGHDFPLTDRNIDFSYYMKMGRRAALYFTINEVEDENGNIINTWKPF